jgi:hypothetical protein
MFGIMPRIPIQSIMMKRRKQNSKELHHDPNGDCESWRFSVKNAVASFHKLVLKTQND